METRPDGSQADDDSYAEQGNAATGGQTAAAGGYQAQGKDDEVSSRGGDHGGLNSGQQARYHQRER
jgi:hypothetical protein